MANKVTQSVDVLILHGMDFDLIKDIKSLFTSLGLTASTVLDLSSSGKTQNERVSFQIKNCGIPLVVLSFDEEEINAKKARPNVYDEMGKCYSFRHKDTIILREIKDGQKVDFPSNLDGKLVIIEFNKLKLHELFSKIITELNGRKAIPKQAVKLNLKQSSLIRKTLVKNNLIEELHHVNLPVRDIKISKEFYKTTFKLREVKRPNVFKFDGAWFELLNGQCLHLVQNVNATYRSKKLLKKDGKAPDIHFAFRVSYKNFFRILAYVGYHKIAHVLQPYPSDFQQLYVLDPDSHIIEITALTNPANVLGE